MKSIDYRDVAVRAVKTFLQTAVTALIAGLNGVDLFAVEQDFWAGLLLSAGAAGVSAVWNALIEPMAKSLSGRTAPEKREETTEPRQNYRETE